MIIGLDRDLIVGERTSLVRPGTQAEAPVVVVRIASAEEWRQQQLAEGHTADDLRAALGMSPTGLRFYEVEWLVYRQT